MSDIASKVFAWIFWIPVILFLLKLMLPIVKLPLIVVSPSTAKFPALLLYFLTFKSPFKSAYDVCFASELNEATLNVTLSSGSLAPFTLPPTNRPCLK